MSFFVLENVKRNLICRIASELILLREMYWWRLSNKRVSVRLVLGHVFYTTYRQQDVPQHLLLKRELKYKF